MQETSPFILGSSPRNHNADADTVGDFLEALYSALAEIIFRENKPHSAGKGIGGDAHAQGTSENEWIALLGKDELRFYERLPYEFHNLFQLLFE